MEIIIASDNLETAIVPHGAEQPEEEEESSESSSEEENEADLPPGPVDPNKCTVGGPGTAGGSAQVQSVPSAPTIIIDGDHLLGLPDDHKSSETCIFKSGQASTSLSMPGSGGLRPEPVPLRCHN